MSLTATPGLNGGGGTFGSGAGILGGRLLGNQFGIVAIGVDAGASNLLRRIGALSRNTGEEVSAAAHGLDVFSGALRASTIILGAAIGAVGTATVIVNEFNETIAKTAGILNEDVDDVMERVGRRAIQLSKQFGFSATEIAEAGRQLAQAGLGLDEVEIALESVTAFATVVGGKFEQSVNLAVRVMNGFKLEATELNDVLNSLTFIINTSPVVISDLEAAFKQLTPVAAQLGISLESTAAAIAAVSRAGLAGSTGGTSLASGLIQLLSPAKQVQDEFGHLIGAFKETLQETGDLAIAMDAFLRQAGTNINEFSATITDLRNNEGLEAFADISDGALEELAERFEVINILLDILGTRSAKGFLDFSVNAHQARLDTLALQLGLNDFRESAEISLQNVNDQLKILRNNLAAPFLEGDFAETLTKGLQNFNAEGLADELGAVFSAFAEEGLATLLDLLPSLIDLLGLLTGAISSLGTFLDFAASVAETATKFLTAFDNLGGDLVVTYLLVSKVFGQVISGLNGLTTKTAELVARQGESIIHNRQEAATVSAVSGKLQQSIAARGQVISQINSEIFALREYNALRGREIAAIDRTIALKQSEIGIRASKTIGDEAAALRNRNAIQALGNDIQDLENQKKALGSAISDDYSKIKKKEALTTKIANESHKEAALALTLEGGARKINTKAIIEESIAKAKNVLLQNALNFAMFAGFGAVFQLGQGHKALGAILTATAAALVAYRAHTFLATGAVQALAASNLALRIILNPLVGAGILAAVTVGLIAFSAKMRSAADDTNALTSEIAGLNREMKNLFPETQDLVQGVNSVVELDQTETEDGDIVRTVQINFEVDETSQDAVRDQLQQLRDAGVNLTVSSGQLIQEDFEGRIEAFEKLVDEIEASGIEVNEDALLENIFGRNADLVRAVVEGELQDVDFTARVVNVEIEDKDKLQAEIQETLQRSIFGFGLVEFVDQGAREAVEPLIDLLAEEDVTTAEAIELARQIQADAKENQDRIDPGVIARINEITNNVITTMENVDETGEGMVTATGEITDEIVDAVEEVPTTFELLKENFNKLSSPLNDLVSAFEGVVLTNTGYATTMSQVTADLELSAEDAIGALDQLKEIQEIVGTLNLIDSVRQVFEDTGKNIPPGLETAFDSLVGTLEENIGVFDTLFGSVDETSKLFDLIVQSGGFIDFQTITDLGASLKQQTITLTNGLEVPTTAFAEMANAGFNVAGALEEFEEFTLRNKIFEITGTIVESLKTLGLTTGDRIFDAWVQTQIEVANQMLSVGENLVDIFDPANFDPNTLVELWAQALESPRFEQNNNIIVRLSTDSTTAEAATLADQIVNKLRGQGVTV